MRTPGFWYEPPGARAALLSPLSLAWRAGAALRRLRTPTAPLAIPSIVIGNLVAGGAGKTPTLLALADLAPPGTVAVSRGYGGRLTGPLRVDPAVHSAADVGDEPLLLAARLPTWIARDRAAGIAAAAAEGARLALLDDGYQNPALFAARHLLVIDGATGFGNGHVMPAGPLREPVAAGIARADAAILIGEDRHALTFGLRAAGLPVWPAEARMTCPLPPGTPIAAFAGLARPQKFFDGLRTQLGLDVVRATPFPDHRRFTAAELAALRARAGDLPLVTTRKDWVRLPPDWQQAVTVAELSLVFAQPSQAETWLVGGVALGTM